MASRPYILGGLALGAGYVWAALRRTPRPVSAELMRFHRAEQLKKLRAIFRHLLEFEKVEQLFGRDKTRESRRANCAKQHVALKTNKNEE